MKKWKTENDCGDLQILRLTQLMFSGKKRLKLFGFSTIQHEGQRVSDHDCSHGSVSKVYTTIKLSNFIENSRLLCIF